MERISKISGGLSGSYLLLCRRSLSRLAQTQFALVNDDAVLPKMPPFDYSPPPPYTGISAAEILKKRQEYLSPSLFHFYSNPLNLVDGKMQYLFDENGRRYLDAFGGIATVCCGHCHPDVEEAIVSQTKRLQHSTVLYLNQAIAEFAEALASKMPGDLKVAFFTNSGTEANEQLAMMMARLYTGCHDIISLRNVYHGNAAGTMSVTAPCNYKFNVVQTGVHHALNPDQYRGVFGSDGLKFAKDVQDLIDYGTCGNVAGFLAEAIQGVGGILELAPGYLPAVYSTIKKAGGRKSFYSFDLVKAKVDKIGPLIGRRAFGEVRLCREKKSGNIYAMKKLKKSEMLMRGQVEYAKAERNLLAEVASHCLVKLYYSFQDAEYLYLIMEYLPGGDMMTLLMREDILSESVAKFYIAQSVLAIESIHKHNYIHGDIKPDNLLLDKSGHMKLSDFGLCKPLDCRALSALKEDEVMDDESSRESMDIDGGFPDADNRSSWKSPREQFQHWQMNRRKLVFSTVGTPDYIAPEVLLKKGKKPFLSYPVPHIPLSGCILIPTFLYVDLSFFSY